MIKETKTKEFWEEVYKGDADAGLACNYLLRKDLLMDNQLNIPESNDNIPDLLNEFEWSSN